MSYLYFMGRKPNMDGPQVTNEDLERLAFALAQTLPELDCPDCCDCGELYQYCERSAELYREEWEWACLANVLIRYQAVRRPQTDRKA
jgi:hypothetical protein